MTAMTEFENLLDGINKKMYNHMTAKREIKNLHRIAKSAFVGSIDKNTLGLGNQSRHPQNFILFSIDSVLGDIFSGNEKNRTVLFELGENWNKKQNGKKNGDIHYDFLNQITETEFETPINFFRELFNAERIKDKCIITYHQDRYKNFSDTEYTIIEMPSLQDLRTFTSNVKGLDALYGALDKYTFPNSVPDIITTLTNLKRRDVLSAIENLIKVSENTGPITKFIRAFGDISNEKKAMAIMVAYLYSINDFSGSNGDFNPYDLYVKFNKYKDTDAITMYGRDEKIHAEGCDAVDQLAKGISERAIESEYKIMESAKKHVESYVNWHSIYNEEIKHYKSYLLFIESYIMHFCRVNEFEYQTIDNRVKTFDSFYDKLFTEANNIILKGDGSENIYKQGIINPKKNHVQIFGKINDIAGIRVICFHNCIVEMDLDDASTTNETFAVKLLQALGSIDYLTPMGNKLFKIYDFATMNETTKKEKQESEDIKELNKLLDTSLQNTISVKGKKNYRGFHTTIKYTCEDPPTSETSGFGGFFLSDNKTPLQCEVQVRTVFAHGFSEIEHQANYKSRNGHRPDEKKLNAHAINLSETDSNISKLMKGAL